MDGTTVNIIGLNYVIYYNKKDILKIYKNKMENMNRTTVTIRAAATLV
jgi:hypothetical protein